ncbi:MAG: ATP-dependent sacrificial sulfur transferase LarE [Bacillota bacterium]|nr:ATP-dependent sacrificial sulfur transferase LarE [Bacillota bacterium]
MNEQDKLKQLKIYLEKLDSLVIAFSGGVDSTFLLKVASEVLGDRVVAVTARSSTYPEREYLESISYAKSFNVKQIVIESEELEIEGFAENPTNRCYLCKQELFTKIWEIADSLKIKAVADGANIDDLGDYRPGMIATKELNVISPLKELNFTKANIRELSQMMNLPTWNKPAFACLSSRFPYGQLITLEALKRVDLAEQYLLDFGFKQVRVRDYGDLARIEVGTAERIMFNSKDVMDQVHTALVDLGYRYVTLDLKGYRTGSMNESVVNLYEI